MSRSLFNVYLYVGYYIAHLTALVMEYVIELQRHAIVIKAGLAMTVALVQIALIFALGRGRVLTAHASAIVAELVSNVYLWMSPSTN